MYKICVLNSVAPKLKCREEKLVALARNWFSDGYRTSAPGTETCQVDSDCEKYERCQAGFCAGLPLRYDLIGVYSSIPDSGDRITHTERHNYDHDYGY